MLEDMSFWPSSVMQAVALLDGLLLIAMVGCAPVVFIVASLAVLTQAMRRQASVAVLASMIGIGAILEAWVVEDSGYGSWAYPATGALAIAAIGYLISQRRTPGFGARLAAIGTKARRSQILATSETLIGISWTLHLIVCAAVAIAPGYVAASFIDNHPVLGEGAYRSIAEFRLAQVLPLLVGVPLAVCAAVLTRGRVRRHRALGVATAVLALLCLIQTGVAGTMSETLARWLVFCIAWWLPLWLLVDGTLLLAEARDRRGSSSVMSGGHDG